MHLKRPERAKRCCGCSQTHESDFKGSRRDAAASVEEKEGPSDERGPGRKLKQLNFCPPGSAIISQVMPSMDPNEKYCSCSSSLKEVIPSKMLFSPEAPTEVTDGTTTHNEALLNQTYRLDKTHETIFCPQKHTEVLICSSFNQFVTNQMRFILIANTQLSLLSAVQHGYTIMATAFSKCYITT